MRLFIISIFIFTISIQANVTKQEVSNELLQYKIIKVEDNAQKQEVEYKKLSSDVDNLNIKVEKIDTDLKAQENNFPKILDSTKESYTFLSSILLSLIGLLGILVVAIYYVLTSAFPKILKKKVESLLEDMSKDGFSSIIQAWLIKELNSLNEQFKTYELEHCQEKDLKNILKKELLEANEVNNDITKLFIEGKLDEAKAKLDESDLTDISAQVLFAQYNLLIEENDQALRFLESAHKSEPKNAYINHLLGLTYYAKQDETNTINFFEKSCFYKSNFEFDYLYLGKYFFDKKNVVQTYFYLHQSSLLFPENIEQYIYLGKLYCETGNIGNAKEILEKIKYLINNRRD